jgi:hypothetical protein
MALTSVGMIGLLMLMPLSTVIADRFSYYFMLPQLFMFASIRTLYGGTRRVFYGVAPYVALFTLFVSWSILSRHFNSCYVPYQFNLPL